MSLRRKASVRRRKENKKFEKRGICKAFKEIVQFIYKYIYIYIYTYIYISIYIFWVQDRISTLT